jgi:hypothetical protein
MSVKILQNWTRFLLPPPSITWNFLIKNLSNNFQINHQISMIYC